MGLQVSGTQRGLFDSTNGDRDASKKVHEESAFIAFYSIPDPC